MPKGKKHESLMPVVGAWAFVLGIILAIIAGFGFAGQGWVALTLGVLGIIVGLVNVGEHESVPFLVAAIAFIVAGSGVGRVLEATPGIGPQLPAVLGYIVVFVGPAAGVVAMKTLYDIARTV